MLLAERQCLVLDPVDQYKENVGTQAHCKYVDRCVDIPSKPFGELLEHNDRRITRSHEEHIHAFSQTELDKAVKTEGDAAQRNEGPCGTPVVCLLIATALGEADEQSYKHKQHVPDAGMKRQEPVPMQQAGGLCEGNCATQKVVQNHKAVHSALQLTGLQPGGNQTHIHRDAAELERKVTPGIAVVHHHKVIEELLENL